MMVSSTREVRIPRRLVLNPTPFDPLPPDRQREIQRACETLVTLTTNLGGALSTAYAVAALFASGLEDES